MAAEVIPDRLYFMPGLHFPGTHGQHTDSKIHYFSIDETLQYLPFYEDYGPLNLSHTYQFCQLLNSKLADADLANHQIVYYCREREQQRSNAAVLIGIYQVLYLCKTATEAYEPLKAFEPYLPFHDATQGICTFRLMPLHCIKAMAKANKFRFFNFDNFSVEEYEYFECVENGDLNILIPAKFLAFSGPHSTNVAPDGYPQLTPKDYLPIFERYGVTTVIRLNKVEYDKRGFTRHGLGHHDMFFIDGTTPSLALLEKFIKVCEETEGMIAVHCKAGLGRTGTTIGCYIMKHWRFTAFETIAWIRICRPGSIIGPQQQFLKHNEARMWKAGKAVRMERKRRRQAEMKQQQLPEGSGSDSKTNLPTQSQVANLANSARQTPGISTHEDPELELSKIRISRPKKNKAKHKTSSSSSNSSSEVTIRARTRADRKRKKKGSPVKGTGSRMTTRSMLQSRSPYAQPLITPSSKSRLRF